jgi:hypothetical protein
MPPRGGWRCIHCGNTSLVRSNFKFNNRNDDAVCRGEEACKKRQNSLRRQEIRERRQYEGEEDE